MSAPSPAQPVFTVLLVCTGNICRSALAERLGRSYLDETFGAEAGHIRLISAGTRAVVDSAMHPASAVVLQGFGAEPGDFGARQLVAEHVVGADLTLTMTRGHRRDVLALDPRAMARTFTLLEAAALLDLVAENPDSAGEDPVDRARGLVRKLAAARPHRHSGAADDVRDPIGLPIEVHQEAGDAIATALLPVLNALAGVRGTQSGRGDAGG